jgi:integrase/recombinase XerD
MPFWPVYPQAILHSGYHSTEVTDMSATTSLLDALPQKYPALAACPRATDWLRQQVNFGLADNTVTAYARGLEVYLRFGAAAGIVVEAATRSQIGDYVRHLLAQEKGGREAGGQVTKTCLANATLQQRLTVLRLFYDYLVEEGLMTSNPVGRVSHGKAGEFGAVGGRILLPRYRKLPWIPHDEQWQAILAVARRQPLRNRLMLALSYDAALRREEVCSLQTGDIDPSRRLLRIRAETTKNHSERVVPYAETTGLLLAAWLRERRALSRAPGALFLSASPRNHAQPISSWGWSKVVAQLASQAEVKQFTTHTPRHLCLTDLARAGWDIHEIAAFAGHRSIQTTMLYIHLSGRDLADKLARGMSQIHAWRIAAMGGAS